MASLSRRRRRRSERQAQRTTAVSYRQIPYRAVEAARRPTRVRTRTKALYRVQGAAGWTAGQRQALQRRKRRLRRLLNIRTAKQKAGRRLSLVERYNDVRRKLQPAPCGQRPNSRRAGLASVAARRTGAGRAKTKQERLAAFRNWRC